MKEFTGIQYIMIDVANHYGLDKELYEDRIEWVLDNENDLESKVTEADVPEQYYAAVMAYRKAQLGEPTGYMVGFDACSSGIQIMGVLMNCKTTAKNTGLIFQNVRSNIYKTVMETMNRLLKAHGSQVDLDPKDVKLAVMTHFYGSTALPESLFGEDTLELEMFYKALNECAPGATIAMQHLLNAWQPYADNHSWFLPDDHYAYVPVKEKVDYKVEVDELDHATFTHRIEVNQGSKTGLSIAANVIHSIDGLIVREMNRRCNHIGIERLEEARDYIGLYLATKSTVAGEKDYTNFMSFVEVERVLDGERSLDEFTIPEVRVLLELVEDVMSYRAFPLVTIHDDFKSHANHVNTKRKHYNTILFQLAGSNILENILGQITQSNYRLPKLGNIANQCKQANYALS